MRNLRRVRCRGSEDHRLRHDIDPFVIRDERTRSGVRARTYAFTAETRRCLLSRIWRVRSDDNWQKKMLTAPRAKNRGVTFMIPTRSTLSTSSQRDIRAIRRSSERGPCQGRHVGSFGTNLRSFMAPCRGPGRRDPGHADSSATLPPKTRDGEAPGQADAQGAATDRFIFDSFDACVCCAGLHRQARRELRFQGSNEATFGVPRRRTSNSATSSSRG